MRLISIAAVFISMGVATPSTAKQKQESCTTVFSIKHYDDYASKVYQREFISKKAHVRMNRMLKCQHSYKAVLKVFKLHKKFLYKRSSSSCQQNHPVQCIFKAAKRWRVSFSMLLRKAKCESGLNPHNYNSSGASGLFQFLPSTWQTTPYRNKSIWRTKWNSLAAAWMHSVGRGGEWVCR